MVSSVASLSLDERELVAGTWIFRARGERDAACHFAWLHQMLPTVDANPVVVAMAGAAIDHELTHSHLCEKIAARYGAFLEPFEARGPMAIETPDGLNEREQILYAVVAFCAVTETLNACLLTDVLKFATCKHIRSVTQNILRDEVKHSRMGWAHLTAERERGVDFLEPLIGPMILEAGAAEIFDRSRPDRCGVALAAHGELDYDRRTDVFCAAMRDVIFPGFESVGIDTSAARTTLKPYLG